MSPFKPGCSHKLSPHPFICGNCLSVSYCGAACAEKDWHQGGHALQCIGRWVTKKYTDGKRRTYWEDDDMSKSLSEPDTDDEDIESVSFGNDEKDEIESFSHQEEEEEKDEIESFSSEPPSPRQDSNWWKELRDREQRLMDWFNESSSNGNDFVLPGNDQGWQDEPNNNNNNSDGDEFRKRVWMDDDPFYPGQINDDWSVEPTDVVPSDNDDDWLLFLFFLEMSLKREYEQACSNLIDALDAIPTDCHGIEEMSEVLYEEIYLLLQIQQVTRKKLALVSTKEEEEEEFAETRQFYSKPN